jgi:hypothetical protein
MKNKPQDLNNHLFTAMERLSSETLTGDKLKEELERSKVISSVAKDIVSNMRLVLEVERHKTDHNYHLTKNKMPDMLMVPEVKDAI